MRSEPEGRFHTVDASPVPHDSRDKSTRTTLITSDGVRIEARYHPGPEGPPGTAVVVAHGFTGSLDRPALRRAAGVFAQRAAVVTFSFRGHGGSSGRSTVGDREVLDLAAAVGWARALGHSRVVTVGFSMGGSVALRHAALHAPGRFTGTGGVQGRTEARAGVRAAHTDAVVSISAPARWYYRGTAPMRRVHWVISSPLGRAVGRYGLRTRVDTRAWDPVPLSPAGAVPLIAPTPLLVVHGERDPYFPLDHPRMLAAAGPAELWVEPGMGHSPYVRDEARNAAGDLLLARIAQWLADREPSAHGS
ncbi:alpha/beta hydrolase family protein [Streptomyces sp. NPDC001985]|uniref:alpha/beta hydrolase family protein n=1 Tax=Streptomyces sp. NPDC001985 TaxID=3154406 RepID=UPI00332EE82A